MKAVFQSIAHAVPDKVLSNADLERLVDTSDEWIVQRTGIRERRISEPEETTASLAISASQKCLTQAQLDPEDLDLIICGTVTGDYYFPSTSCLVQQAIGARNAGVFDLGAACAGFIYSVSVATAMIESGQVRNALVIGGDVLSKFVDWTDRGTCVLFGDGAGAALLSAHEGNDRGVLKSVLMADGCGAKLIGVEQGGSRYPFGSPISTGRGTKIFMAGSEVYRFAVNAIGDVCCRALESAGLNSDDIDLFVPHQANLRIIESAAKRLELPPEKVFVNVHKYGNTSGGSIPIALSEAAETGRLQPGMIVVTVGFGAGLVWGANVIRW
jgi:3-oxoacyl-[acyl-carrier-protein] synthase-3